MKYWAPSPYQRASMYHQPAIPEDEVQGGSLQVSILGSYLINVRVEKLNVGGNNLGM